MRVKVGAGAVIVVAVLGAIGYWFWHQTEKDRKIAEQTRVIGELEKKLDRAFASELVGDLRIDGLKSDPPSIDATFFQYVPGSETPIFARRMTVPGTEIYVDALVVTFERKYVEGGDGLRGKSLLLFRRAFGDEQKPNDGVPLFRGEGLSPIPEVAQVDATPGDFEKGLWNRFWDDANDPQLAAKDGVRVAQGEAPHVKPLVGQVYKLTLRAAGGLEMLPRLPAAVTR